MELSVIIPTLNASATLPATLAALASHQLDIIISDGGSTDATQARASESGARVIAAPRGRGPQLAAGAECARHDWLLLLHADTRLQPGWHDAVRTHMHTARNHAAYFRFALDSDAPQARRLERMVAWRCRALALPYGDQGLLIHRSLLEHIGGIRPLPLMEDVDLIRRIGRARLRALNIRAVTSAGKFQRDGWYWRSARNLFCLTLYFLGVPPRLIARLYT